MIPSTSFFESMVIHDAHSSSITSVKFSPSGDLVASSSSDKAVKIWNGSTGAALATLSGHSQGVSDVAWTADGSYLSSASDDTTIRIWDAATGVAACAPLRGHANFVFCLAFCPRTNLLASGSFDESLRLWDLRTGQCIRAIPAHSEPITTLAFNGDGSLLATGSYDGLIRLWDVAGMGQCLKTIQEEGVPPVSCVRWAPNNRYLLAASLDSAVRLWDPISSRRMRTLRGHSNSRFCASTVFLAGENYRSTSDGISGNKNRNGFYDKTGKRRQLIACGGEEGKISLWDLESKTLVQELGGHKDLVLSLDAHPFSDKFVSGGSSIINTTSGSGALGDSKSGVEQLTGDFSLRFWSEHQNPQG